MTMAIKMINTAMMIMHAMHWEAPKWGAVQQLHTYKLIIIIRMIQMIRVIKMIRMIKMIRIIRMLTIMNPFEDPTIKWFPHFVEKCNADRKMAMKK